MTWVPTSVPAKNFPTASWDELAKLEKASPGLTRVPPSKLVSTIEIESTRRLLLSSQIVAEALEEAKVGRKKRTFILRKIAGKTGSGGKASMLLYKLTKDEVSSTEKKKETRYAKA